MTDKQIIDEMIEKIGFDVQQCGYLKITKDAPNYPEIGGTFTAFECNLYSRDCDFIERCRYKQLLRKEQECEELKKSIEHWKMEHKEAKAKGEWTYDLVKKRLGKQLDQLKAENDTLRQFLSKEPLALQALQSGYASYKKSSDVFYEMVKQYKQTLTEIKEIAEKQVKRAQDGETFARPEIKQILQKISECEVKNE